MDFNIGQSSLLNSQAFSTVREVTKTVLASNLIHNLGLNV